MKSTQALSRAARQATNMLLRGWVIMPLSIGIYFALRLASVLISPLGGMVGGLLLGIATLLALVQFYSWCWRLTRGHTLHLKTAFGLVDHVFSNIAFVGFILWIAFALVAPAGSGDQSPISVVLKLAAAFLFNPIAEVAVLGLATQGGLFTESFRITKDHLIPWFLPIVILIAIGAAVQGAVPSASDLVMQFANGFDVMFPAGYFISISSWILDNSYLSIALAAPLACWFTLFRLSLLEQLE